MKTKLLTTLLLGASVLVASPLYLLQITNNDLSTIEVGPEAYQDWVSSGFVSYLVTAVETGQEYAFTFLPCPEFGGCIPVSTVAPAPLPLPLSRDNKGHENDGSAVPEPTTTLLALAGLVGVCWVSERNKRRG